LRACRFTTSLAHSTARLVVNRQALKLKRAVLKPLIQRLRELSGS